MASSLYSELQGKYTSEKLDLFLLFDRLEELKPKEEEVNPVPEKPKKSAEQILAEAKDLAKDPEYQGDVETEGIGDKKPKEKTTGHKFGTGSKTGNIIATQADEGAGRENLYDYLLRLLYGNYCR